MSSLKYGVSRAHLFQKKIARLQVRYFYRHRRGKLPDLLTIDVKAQKGLVCPSYPIQKESCQEDQIDLNDRFYGPCVQSACGHWFKNHCQLGVSVSKVRVVMKTRTSSCPIKTSCRWLRENGTSACRGCAYVDYNLKLSQETKRQSGKSLLIRKRSTV
jgi:hypothetical protein